MNRWLIVAILVIVAAVAWASAAAYRSGVPVESALASRGHISEFVDERGTTRLPQIHLVTMPYDGQPAKPGYDSVACIITSACG